MKSYNKNRLVLVVYLIGWIFTNGFYQNNYVCSGKEVNEEECHKAILGFSVISASIWPLFWTVYLAPYVAPSYKKEQ